MRYFTCRCSTVGGQIPSEGLLQTRVLGKISETVTSPALNVGRKGQVKIRPQQYRETFLNLELLPLVRFETYSIVLVVAQVTTIESNREGSQP